MTPKTTTTQINRHTTATHVKSSRLTSPVQTSISLGEKEMAVIFETIEKAKAAFRAKISS